MRSFLRLSLVQTTNRVTFSTAGKAFDFMTEGGKKKMDYGLFCEFIKKFLTNEEPNHPVNCGLC